MSRRAVYRPEFAHEPRIVKAQVDHLCYKCGGVIPKGKKYLDAERKFVSGRFGYVSFRWCAACARAAPRWAAFLAREARLPK